MEPLKTHFPDKNRWNLDSDTAYLAWRGQKLEQAFELLDQSDPTHISDIANPSTAETSELIRRCDISNAATYHCTHQYSSDDSAAQALKNFTQKLGLNIAEKHRSAGNHGIVSLQLSESVGKMGYIPYSKKPMNWHTDGYYNAPDQKIRAVLLHCVRAARSGGANQFFDPEIVYIRLRDDDPAHIAALMHPEAMTIPENLEATGNLRPVSIGPVFAIDPATGNLEMRYTARTRSILWRDDPATQRATSALTELLKSADPCITTIKMEAGMGVLCNNALHNRTGFDTDTGETSDRLMMRVRFHNRLKGDEPWQS